MTSCFLDKASYKDAVVHIQAFLSLKKVQKAFNFCPSLLSCFHISKARQVPLISIWSLSNGAEIRVCHRENISTSSAELLIWSNTYPGVSSTCIKYICKCLFIFVTSMSHCTSCLEKKSEKCKCLVGAADMLQNSK